MPSRVIFSPSVATGKGNGASRRSLVKYKQSRGAALLEWSNGAKLPGGHERFRAALSDGEFRDGLQNGDVK